jgi:hypothetical protein
MYSTCIICHSELGANEVVERFPVGRRLAFDAEKGRLWVVCANCGRWNLSPLEERWEAIEECERLFRDTRLRASTEQIGLARMADGTELVRIGRPLRPEFAAWRYGDLLGGRLKRSWLSAGTAAGVATAVGGTAALFAGVVAAAPLILVGLPIVAVAEAMKAKLPRGITAWQARRALRALRDDGGEPVLEETHRHLRYARIQPGAGHGWTLKLETGLLLYDTGSTGSWTGERDHLLTDARAVRALSLLLARPNAGGGTRGQVQDAVRAISRVGTPERYFAQAERDARDMGWGYQNVWAMPVAIRLALEMASHENAERRALEGELAELEAWWREAEEIAAVADTLGIPPEVERRLDRSF